MNYWDHQDWKEFCKKIVAEPDDRTNRLVAADWLCDGPCANEFSEYRARQIQGMLSTERVIWHTPADIAQPAETQRSMNTAIVLGGGYETILNRLAGVELWGGFVRTAIFWPWTFNQAFVQAVLALHPIRRVEIAHVRPQWIGNPAEQNIDYPHWWRWARGPESPTTGNLENVRDLGSGEWGRQVRDAMRTGSNPLQYDYDTYPNQVPSPVYEHLQDLNGGVNTLMLPGGGSRLIEAPQMSDIDEDTADYWSLESAYAWLWNAAYHAAHRLANPDLVKRRSDRRKQRMPRIWDISRPIIERHLPPAQDRLSQRVAQSRQRLLEAGPEPSVE